MIKLTDFMKGRPIDYFPIKLHALQDEALKKVSLERLLLSEIMFVVSFHTGIPEEDIKRRTRKKEIVYARQLFSYFANMMTKKALADIAFEVYPSYDHCSVIHSIKTINNLIFSDPKVRKDVGILKYKLMKRMEK
jgi:chromosomal replication initiator protein